MAALSCCTLFARVVVVGVDVAVVPVGKTPDTLVVVVVVWFGPVPLGLTVQSWPVVRESLP